MDNSTLTIFDPNSSKIYIKLMPVISTTYFSSLYQQTISILAGKSNYADSQNPSPASSILQTIQHEIYMCMITVIWFASIHNKNHLTKIRFFKQQFNELKQNRIGSIRYQIRKLDITDLRHTIQTLFDHQNTATDPNQNEDRWIVVFDQTLDPYLPFPKFSSLFLQFLIITFLCKFQKTFYIFFSI